jgi:hypothetical protein
MAAHACAKSNSERRKTSRKRPGGPHMPKRGVSDMHEHDRPLSFHWRPLNLKPFDDLALPAAGSQAEQLVRASILTEAYLVGRGEPSRWISYSRNKSWWSAAPRYRGSDFTFTTVRRTVDLCTVAGLLENIVAPQGTYQAERRQSI